VLAIDPEDLQAHYNLMLCYQGLRQPDMAQKHRVRYERFKADEASQAITGPYRQLHPHDNNERQPIHEHRSAAPASAPRRTYETRAPVPRPHRAGKDTEARPRSD
jgi:hypothetical protein